MAPPPGSNGPVLLDRSKVTMNTGVVNFLDISKQDGVVSISGAIHIGASTAPAWQTAGQTILTLPAGWRPAVAINEHPALFADAGVTIDTGTVDVSTAGVMTVGGGTFPTADDGDACLLNLKFLAAPAI